MPWKRVDALDIYVWRTGRLAPASDSRRVPAPDGRIRRMMYLAFTDSTLEPQEYQAWVARSRQEMQQKVADFNRGGPQR
jgi:hypothetical protein